MSSPSLDACRRALSRLMSEEHKKMNFFVFFVPIDLSTVPDYLSVCSRAIDLGTIRSNLEAGRYGSAEAFWKDVDEVFANAIKYHEGKKQTKWIAAAAKAMIKLVNKEKRAMGIAVAGKKKSSGSGLKLKLSTKLEDTTSKPKPKVSLKLKAPKAPTPPAAPAGGEGEKKKPKIKLSLSLGKKKATASSSATSPAPPAKPGKTLTPKLKISTKQKPATPAGASSSSAAPKSASSSKASKPSQPPPKLPTQKIRITAPSRGKELPKGVTQAAPRPSSKQPNAASSSTSSSSGSSKKRKSGDSTKPGESKKSKKSAPPPPGTLSPAAKIIREQGSKVLAGLKRRQTKTCVWFLHPVSDKAFVDDYRAKIPNPMDLGTMATKLEKGHYTTAADFVLDLRRVFANCLRFNTTKQDSFRPLAVQMLVVSEELCACFFRDTPYPKLLYCWKLCVGILDALVNVTNPSNGHQTAHFFMHPASYFFGGAFPPDYLQKVKQPMDLGTVTSTLVEGKYQKVPEFANDCRMVIDNCLAYYGSREDGNEYVQQANHLKALMSQQLDALLRYDQSSNGAQARANQLSHNKAVTVQKPPESLLLGILQDLRNLTYTDRLTKMTQPAMGPFGKPVSLTLYPNYLQFVETPMDLETVSQNIKSGKYQTPEDFEHDVHLIFKNCEAFNAPRKTDQLVAMGKWGAKEFRKLFSKRMKAFENPEEASTKKRSGTPQGGAPKVKKIKTEVSRASSVGSAAAAGGKHSPSATAAKGGKQSSSSTTVKIGKQALSSVATKTGKQAPLSGAVKRGKSPKLPLAQPKAAKPNQPVPLHVAIAEVKSRYPLRRQLKFLADWEAACAKFFKEFLKNPWISAARPKFIYHVPVPTIFPELAEVYLAKIHNPMDLTTVEAKLLQGGLYHTPQDFIDDVALVFANAITFNKAGRDEGDHLSISYYDASVHLLRYSRWLSLEHLSGWLSDDPHPDNKSPDGTPPTNWKLSKINRQKAHEEMEALVMKEKIDKSIEGDRTYTWMETECEKLLKALRHQSDLRYMTFFIKPDYPADYAAFIPRPMDWERVQRTLHKRQYNKIEDVVADLRLIFTNALKYNSRHKDTDTVSGRAFDAAIYMSKKLEAAIDKMLLNVSDRLERERVENAISDREQEAVEKAEEERLRQAALKGEAPPNASAAALSSNPNSQTKTETVETVRIVNRRPKRDVDLEVAFFEEDDGNHEQSHVEYLKQQRVTFDRQLAEKEQQAKLSNSIGALLFARLSQVETAENWSQRMGELLMTRSKAQVPPSEETKARADEATKLGSKVRDELKRTDRVQIKMQLGLGLRQKRRKTRSAVLDFSD